MNKLQANLDELSANLQRKISSRPTKTTLQSGDDSPDQMNAYKKILRGETPYKFDGKMIWGALLSPVRNQGKCGSCWAFASTSTLADRFNIQSMGVMDIELSAAKLIICDWRGKGLGIITHPSMHNVGKDLGDANLASVTESSCFGNSLSDAVRYLYEIGTTTDKCVPYDKQLGDVGQYQKLGSFDTTVNIPLCNTITGMTGDMCAGNNFDERTGIESGTPSKYYKCVNYYGIRGHSHGGGELQIRLEIYRWGPIAAGMEVYPDFYTFDARNKIYEWDGVGKQVGGHAVEIVGWGVDGGVPYWQIKNTWGKDWGRDGYFRMVRGKNNCKLEANCVSVQPDFFYPIGYKYVQPVELTITNPVSRSHNTAIRNEIALKAHIIAGGINVTTGYSRRVMTMYPWLNFRRDVSLEDLPNWDDFMAGKVGSSTTIIDGGGNRYGIYVVVGLVVGLVAVIVNMLLKSY